VTFRRIDSYATTDPEKLADQLTRLEDNIVRALAALTPRLAFTDWYSVGPVQCSYDAVTRVDTSVAAAAIGATLPSVSLATIGQSVGIVRSGAQNIELHPIESTALIDGADPAFLTADGLYLYMHDGARWYRV
jgi:hypothetical protein